MSPRQFYAANILSNLFGTCHISWRVGRNGAPIGLMQRRAAHNCLNRSAIVATITFATRLYFKSRTLHHRMTSYQTFIDTIAGTLLTGMSAYPKQTLRLGLNVR